MNKKKIVFMAILLPALFLGMSMSGQESPEKYRKAAEQGDPAAQNSLANCYYNGTGVARDYAEAVNWYRKAAAQGYAKSQYNLGTCYRDGTGVPKNYPEALRLFRLAAEQGNAKAQYCVGLSYDKGPWGVTRDFAEAATWYRKAAEQGFHMAQWSLGNCYQLGEGIAQDYTEAVKWYRKAAEQGYDKAQNSLAICYDNGWGVARDSAEAMKWYRKAAEQGNLSAKNTMLAKGNDSGNAATKEESKAVKSSPKAVEQGDAEAQKDDLPPYILPISANDSINPGAGRGLGLTTDPGPLLDAMGGNRDGGDVTAMMVLLRQAGGPLSEEEDTAMNKKWAPYAASGSSKAHKAIRRQSELLLQSMAHRQMMVQAAREYDFALAHKQIAVLMGDDEEASVAETTANIQRQVAEHAQQRMVALNKESEAAPQIPTPAELKAEEDAERKNAETALGPLKKESIAKPPVKPSGKVLLGYLKLVSSTAEIKPFAKANPSVGTCVVEGNSVSCTKVVQTRGGRVVNDPKADPTPKTDIRKYACSWQTPGVIPVYANAGPSVLYADYDFPFSVAARDTGSQLSDGGKIADGVSVRISAYDFQLNVGPGKTDARIDRLPLTSHMSRDGHQIIDDQVIGIDDMARWHATIRYRFEAKVAGAPEPEPVVQQADPIFGLASSDAIAEHQSNIASTTRVLQRIRAEMAGEQNPTRREELRLQALHMEQNIHDSQDLIESIRTGSIVKTRGPWDEHATAVMAQSSMRMIEDFQRAQQMQASYVRMIKALEKHNPEQARKLYDSYSSQMIKGVYDPGGFDRARKALNALHDVAGAASKEAQQRNYADLEVRKAELDRSERNLAIAESVKRNCDRAIFAGTLFTGMAPGLALSMIYEGSCVTAEKGPREGIKSMVIQGGIMLGSMGVLKVGGWAIGKLLNPKVVQSEVNSFKNILEANRYKQEMEWNKALVNKLKEKAASFEKSKASGGKNYLQVRAELDDAVSAVNSSSLAKNIMKNEFVAAEKTLAGKGGKEAAAALNEINAYQNLYNKRLQNSIYPRTDAQMVKSLNKQGYNAEAGWFREFRNATSRGANRDRDLGLIAQFEGKLTKNGKSVSLNEFMQDGQKAYNASYKQVTGRSAALADQNITSSAHSESFPIKWLEQKLGTTGDPLDYGKAGTAIYNKVRNAMSGPDPAFVNLKKACSSLGKDLKTKVLPRLEKPVAGSAVSETSRKAAMEHWKDVQKVMDDFASDKIDPLTAMRKLQQFTGSTSVTQSAAEIQRLMIRLGGTSR